MSVLGAAAISAGSSVLSNVFNVGSQQRHNATARRFTEDMYERQKKDNIDFWNMQNAYNTPAEQMKRFTDAGLNPHLIYGQTNAAAPISSAQPTQGPNTQAAKIDFDPLSHMAQGLNLQMMNEQVRSQKLSNDVKALELADEQWFRQNYAEIEGVPFSGESLYRQKKRSEVDSSILSLETAVLDQARIEAVTGQAIEATKLLELQQVMQGIENDLAENGIFRGDSVFDRILMEMTDDNFIRLLGSGSVQAIGTAAKMILDRVIGKKVYRK